MLCKKCKTAVADSEKRCGYCGVRLNRGRRIKLATSIMMTCAVISVCGVFIYLNGAGLWQPEAEAELPQAEASMPPEETANPLVLPTESAAPVNSPTTDLRKDMDEVWQMLDDVYKSTMLYTALNDTESPFVSQNGYLYNARAGVNAYVTTRKLIEAEMLDKAYEDEKILLLYLRPNDMRAFTEVQMGSSEALSVFVAYETRDGIAILGAGTARGVLYRESMGTLLEQYAVTGGEIVRPGADDPIYQEILAVIREEISVADVRYMAMNGQHAFVVASAADAPETLSFHIVEMTEDGWKVRPFDTRAYTHYEVNVNRTAANMNINLLPGYKPKDVRLLTAEPLTAIVDGMLTVNAMTAQDGPVVFASGNEEWLYVVLQSGRRFLGYYDSGAGWEMTLVQDWAEAEAYMHGMRKMPPLYIIWQE